VCSNPTTVSKTEFLQAIAVAPGKTASAVASAGYVINPNAVSTPTFNPAGGTYTGAQQVTISDSISGANIYYTLDGTTPTKSSTLYTAPITISQSETLQAIAVATGYANSGVASAAYTIQAVVAVPTISSLSPTSATVGDSAFTLTVNGSDFDPGSTVKWGSTALTTTYVSSTQLTASVPANLIASAGPVVVSVVTSAGASAYNAFTVNPALPTITSLSPTSSTAGGAGFTLTVNGTNFDSSAKINWNGSALATTYVSATQLTAAVPANLIASAGTASISVSTTAGTSGASTITIQSGTPTITGITPSSATAGGAAFTLTVNGTNFDSSAKVSWNGTSLTTSYVSASQITAAVPASLIASAGTISIAVTTAAGTSSTSSFTVQAASPTISGTSPTSATVGGAAFTLTVNGTNFDSSTKVNWNGAALTTTYVSGTKVTANVPASLIASVGTANISVTTNAGTSAVSTFTIQLGVPTITTISPTSVTVGGSAFTLTVNGSNFDSSAVVKWNGTALATTPLSSTQLTATVPASLIASTGSASITVATSVGTSSANSLAIQQAGVPTISTLDPASVTAGGSAFLLTVNGTGFDSSSVVKWNSTALTTIYVNSTELQTAISASLVASSGTVSVTVSGTGGASTASSFAIKLGTPTISGFSPTSASSNDPTFTMLTVNGTNFDSSAVVNWNGTALTTTFVNATQITASVPASLIASPGTAGITVTTTVGTSAASSFTIDLGKPTISSTDPTSVTAGGSSFTLKVIGTNFDSSAKINWNGTALTTTLVSATEVDASIDSSLIATASSATITVTTTTGTSATSYTLTINAATPVITSLTPPSGAVGDTVVIAGSNFGASQGASTVMFGTTAATVSSGNWSNNSITTTVPAGITGTVAVAVTVNGAQSNTDQTFTVTAALPTISGTVVSGTVASGKPIIGATVELYAVGIGGYKTAGTSLGTATTGSDGSFSIGYTCPTPVAGDQLYLVATGGSITSGKTNSDLALMTALGSCNLSTFPSSSVIVNEVSTVASAYALAQFSKNTASGSHGILIGTSSGNYIGLDNAMKTVSNLYNSATGIARAVTASYDTFAKTHVCASAYASHVTACASTNNSTYDAAENLNASYVPQARIHTLANLLNTCASSADGSGCSDLISAATPSSTAPADTLQAILNIAQNPGTNASSLYAVQSTNTTFAPRLTSAPTDWTLALTFTGGGLGAPSDSTLYPPVPIRMVIDATGGLWVTVETYCSSGVSYFARFDNLGNALSMPATNSNGAYCGGGQQTTLNGNAISTYRGIAFDTDGTFWATATGTGSSIAKFDASGSILNPYYFTSVNGTIGVDCLANSAMSMALDASEHLWIGSYDGFNDACIAALNTSDGSAVDGSTDVSTAYGYGSPVESLVVDPNGTAWGVIGEAQYLDLSGDAYLFSNAISNSKTPISRYSSSGKSFEFSIATDADGNLYTPSATPGTLTKATTSAASFSTLTYNVPSGARGVTALAIDGAGHLWGAAYGGVIDSAVSAPSYLVEFDSTGNILSPSNAGSSVYGYYGTGGGGESHSIFPSYAYGDPFAGAAVDSSGNLWTVSGELNDNTVMGNEIAEFIGLAAPVRTPIAAAFKNVETGMMPTTAGPVVTSLSETSGSVGDAVTITGTGFGATSSLVAFNGIGATVSSWSDTSITVTVPTSATTGNVYVFASTGLSSNGAAFTVK
jgi:predicted heme/steroid binding protein